jgi:hypothetical protein
MGFGHAGQVAKVRVDERHSGAERRQPLGRHRDRARVRVQPEQASSRPARTEQRLGVAAAAEGAVDEVRSAKCEV